MDTLFAEVHIPLVRGAEDPHNADLTVPRLAFCMPVSAVDCTSAMGLSIIMVVIDMYKISMLNFQNDLPRLPDACLAACLGGLRLSAEVEPALMRCTSRD